MGATQVSPIIPPKDPDDLELVGTGVKLPKKLLVDLDEIAEDERYSRNEIIIHMLKWGVREYHREKGTSPGDRPSSSKKK